MSKLLLFLAALAVILGGGLAHGAWTERWHRSAELESAAARLLKVPLRAYLASAFVPALWTAAGPAAALGLLTRWHEPETWPDLVAYTAAFGALYLVMACVGLIGVERIRLQGREVLRGLLGAR